MTYIIKNRFQDPLTEETYVDVIEGETGNTILCFSPSRDAEIIITNLRKGGGFDGFTPSFFLKD